MHHANNTEQEETHDERNETTKSRKNQNAQGKRNFKILGNIGSGHYQTSEDEIKK